MRNVGFNGGSFLCELGPAEDVELFFFCVSAYAAPSHPERDWSLLSDRLYRRYLRQEELGDAAELMTIAFDAFARVPSSAVDWTKFSGGVTRLDSTRGTLADVFSKYFESFTRCVESSRTFFEDWSVYQPVRTVVADLPDYMHDKKRPLEEYEVLTGSPFWWR